MEIIGNRIKLRKFRDDDILDIYEYASDRETVKFLTWPAHNTLEETQYSLDNFLMKDGAFAIEYNANRKVIGCIDLRIDNNNVASFGYVLNRKYWNQGIMSEALSLIIDYAFNVLNVDEIFGLCEKENIGSARVMQKCNMKWVGQEKEKKVKDRIVKYEKYHLKRI